MARLARAENHMLDTSVVTAADNWHKLLRLQTEMFISHEVRFFLNSKIWESAHDVLDVGCGNGAYISQISNFFPEKSYTALDASAELISIAKRECAQQNIDFQHQGFETFQAKRPFDVIIMRLVVQHMKDFPAVLSKALTLLKPGGTLLIIEPDFDHFCNWPATPEFNQMMQNIEEHSSEQQTNRCLLSVLGEIAVGTGHWGITDDVVTVSPYVGPFKDTNLLNLYQLWLDILDQSKILPMSLGNVRDELKHWAEEPASYAQIGIRFLHLESKIKTH